MEPFLKGVATYIHTRYSGKTKDIAVIFPGKRSRLYLNKYLSELSDKPVWAPAYYTITELMEHLSGLQVAEKITLIFELFEVYKKVTGTAENIDDFYFYCEMILSDFDDVDKYLVNPDDLFKNLADLKNLSAYFEYLNPDQISIIQRFWDTFATAERSGDQNNFISLWDALSGIYHEFTDLLIRKKIAYEGMVYRQVAEKIKKGELKLTGFDTYLFVGFNALNKAEEVLFSYLKKTGKAEFFWDYDEYYINNSIHEAGFLLRENRIKFPSPEVDISFINLTSKGKKIKFISIPSDTGQTAAITDILREIIKTDKSNEDNTAVVLGDESLLMPALAAIPEEFKEVNVSMGYPYKNSVYYDILFNLAKLDRNYRLDKNGVKLFYYRDVIVLLDHPLLNSVDTEKINTLKKKIVGSNIVYISENELSMNEIFKAIASIPLESKAIPAYLTEIFKSINKSFYQNSGENSLTAYNSEFLFYTFSTINRLNELVKTSATEFTSHTLYKLLLRILEGLSIPFSGEPLKGIQVLGILETRCLDFENIVMLSLNEGVFPKTGHIPTFIPLSLRHGFNLPVPDHRDALYAYYFYRLIQRADNISFVFNSRHDGLFTGEKSRFLNQIYYDPVFNVLEENYSTTVTSNPAKVISAAKNERVMNILSGYVGERARKYLTPSAVNTYLDCSLWFYYKYIEGLKEPEELLEELDSALFGSILHKAVEIIYKPYKETDITPEILDHILKNKDLLKNSLDEAFTIEYFGGNAQDLKGRNLILREIISKYLEKILCYDRENTPFKILDLEYKFQLGYQVNDQLKIRVGGIIDRLDLQKGITRIIDYKTGRPKNSFTGINSLFDDNGSERNGAVFQIMMYSLLLERTGRANNILPGLYFIRDIYNEQFDYHLTDKENKKIVENASDYYNEFENRLKNKIEELFNPAIPFTQTDDLKVCEFCPQKAICHRG